MHTFEQRNEMRHYRRVFAEMPIGDPTSGAAYGEYLKSKALGMIIGVVSAVAAVWTGGASLAAMSASGAWSVGSALSAGAMVAGGVMSGVGAVTGNKKLMKIGGVLSLAGGIGTMMTGGIGGAGAAAETGTAGVSPVATETTTVAGDTLSSKIGDAFGQTADVAKTSGMADSALSVDAVSGASTGSTSTGYDLGSGVAAPKPTPTIDSGSGLAGAGGTNSIPAPLDVSSPLTPPPSTGGGILGDAYNKVGDAVSGAGKFFKDNKELVEIGGKMLMGATDPERDLTGAKQALYDAQTTATNATANATNQQATSLQQRRELEAQQAKNANTQILMLDPRDPQYAAKKAEAAAKGIPTMDYTVPGQSGPILGGNQQWATNTQTPNVAPQQLQRLQR